GTRTHEAHVAFKHVPELGQFIEVPFPHKGADLQAAGIAFHRPLRAADFGIQAHGAEFKNREGMSVAPCTDLAIDDWTGALAFDDDCECQHDWRGDREPNEGANNIDR